MFEAIPNGAERASRFSIARALTTSRAFAAGVIAVAAPIFAWAEPPQGDLVIHARGFAHERGQAIANLFREGQGVFGKPAARVAAAVHQSRAEMIFPRLPYGTYAVIVFHDENGNNEVDHNVLGLPAEPLGFSNGFSLSLFSGKPSFEKLRFAFTPGAKPLEITVK